jgi:hypothetical protein
MPNDFFTKEDEYYLMEGHQVTPGQVTQMSKLQRTLIRGKLRVKMQEAESRRGIMRELVLHELAALEWKYLHMLKKIGWKRVAYDM